MARRALRHPEDAAADVKIQVRELAEVVTTDNLGVVPDAFSSEIIGRIDEGRPFLNTTRQVPTPPSGMNLVLPKITQTPLVAAQAAEKDEVASSRDGHHHG